MLVCGVVWSGVEWCVLVCGVVCAGVWSGVSWCVEWCVLVCGGVCAGVWRGVCWSVEWCVLVCGVVCAGVWSGVCSCMECKCGVVWYSVPSSLTHFRKACRAAWLLITSLPCKHSTANEANLRN